MAVGTAGSITDCRVFWRRPAVRPSFAWHCWRRDLTNLSLLGYRDFDGFLVSMHNSGTQWTKYMLSMALSHEYGLPEPRYVQNASSNELVGHPKHPRKHPHAPRIASSHSIPPIWFDSRLLQTAVNFPQYAILVRDIRASLVSTYEKWKDTYAVSFSEFLNGDPAGKRYASDVWWFIHFLNRWGRLVARFPDKIRVVRYEDLRNNTGDELKGVFDHFGISVSAESVTHAVRESSKDKMASRYDPDNPEQNIVRNDPRPYQRWYSASDDELLNQILRDNLKYALGYDYGLAN
jgi:hypothetical protein